MRSVVLFAMLLLSGAQTAFAQKMEGEITYEKIYRWITIFSKLSFMSNEEKDRMKMSWANMDENKQDMILLFNEKQTYYSFPKNEENTEGWVWRKGEFNIYRDLENEKRTDILDMLGRTYIIEDSLRAPKWKVMNKIKEVAGYMCMMAVSEDTVKKQKVVAWFADNLPVSGGPEFYSGLPGMILEMELNDGDVVVTAKKVEMKPVKEEDLSVPKKVKGRKIDAAKYDQLIAEHIRDSIKSHRYPYDAVPYPN